MQIGTKIEVNAPYSSFHAKHGEIIEERQGVVATGFGVQIEDYHGLVYFAPEELIESVDV